MSSFARNIISGDTILHHPLNDVLTFLLLAYWVPLFKKNTVPCSVQSPVPGHSPPLQTAPYSQCTGSCIAYEELPQDNGCTPSRYTHALHCSHKQSLNMPCTYGPREGKSEQPSSAALVPLLELSVCSNSITHSIKLFRPDLHHRWECGHLLCCLTGGAALLPHLLALPDLSEKLSSGSSHWQC